MWLNGRREELAEELIKIPMAIANSVSPTMARTEVDQDDVVSWALESMWKAIQGWDSDGKVPLRGWIAFRVRRDIIDVQRLAGRKKRGADQRRIPIEYLENVSNVDLEGLHVCSHNPDADEHEPDTNRKLAHSMTEARAVESTMSAGLEMRRALEKLPEHQQEILKMLATGSSLREVGKALGISYEWVRQEAERARACLKEHSE
jgi:RNA polymerase sigma factor (sigma-70 family)